MSLLPHLHILPDALAQSPGYVAEHYPTPMAALRATERLLSPLPEPLRRGWLAGSDGHVVINISQHAFIPGPNQAHKRLLEDVAWVQASRLVTDPAGFLTPVGHLIHHLILDRWHLPRETNPAIWEEFWGGLTSCQRAGYAASHEASEDISLYLAVGIARWLADRRELNLHDPRLEKLLAVTVFEAAFYRNLARLRSPAASQTPTPRAAKQ